MNIILQIFKLTYPVIVVLISVILAFTDVTLSESVPKLDLNLYFVSIPLDLNSDLFSNLVFLGVAIVGLTYSLLRKYGELFSKIYEFNVYYDKQGLVQSIQLFDKYDIETEIDQNWQSKRRKIFEEFDKLINENSHISGSFFSNENFEEHLVGEGRADHEIKYYGFWQRYKITKIEGNITHILEPPNCEAKVIESKYSLLNTSRNLVEPSLIEFINLKIVASPRMKQWLTTHDQTFYETDVIGITLSRYFPFTKVERTIFCADSDSDDVLIPLAYAKYSA